MLAHRCRKKLTGGQIYPQYHFERTGTHHAPLWVCVLTLDEHTIEKSSYWMSSSSHVESKEPCLFPLRRFRSTKKAKKLEAQNEAAQRGMEALNEQEQDDGKLNEKPEAVKDDTVALLDRCLMSLEQAPAVYSIVSATVPANGGSITMWTCSFSATLRPRPCHMDPNHDPIWMEGYPRLQGENAQAKKFDAKLIVAKQALIQLQILATKNPGFFQEAEIKKKKEQKTEEKEEREKKIEMQVTKREESSLPSLSIPSSSSSLSTKWDSNIELPAWPSRVYHFAPPFPRPLTIVKEEA